MVNSDSFQDGPNGALALGVRKRIRAVREKLGYSWVDLGAEFDFSNTFMHGISRDLDPLRIRTKHVKALIQNLEGLEVKAGILKVANSQPASVAPPPISSFSLEDLVAAITSRGFAITLTPN